MIIVLFHALYLLGKYVYDNFHPRIDKTEDAKPADQLLNVTEADYRDPTDSDHIADDQLNFVVKFFPPVYVQRYTTVLDVLTSPQYHGKIRKVIDFGCAELSFAVLLKNTEGIEEIYCVDVDRSLLENYQSKVAPLHCDYLCLRTEPLSIHVCEGSIAHNDKKLENTDAAICIELIEHLYPDDLDAFPHNVFGFIKPQVAIVTTPNVDFNVLFKGLNGFRHADHKFEWTRVQFQDWANNIVLRYPDYEVSFHGIGSGPGGTEHLGSCSQMAVFHRHSQVDDDKSEGVDDLLKTVVSHKYPYRVDNRSDEEKILDEAVYYIKLYSARDEELSEEIPLTKLMFSVEKFRISVEILKSILEEANWAIAERENGPVVLIPPQSTFSVNSGVDFDDFLDNDYRNNDDNDWDTLEPGIPRSYFFDTYMEGDPHTNEEEENWDDPTQDTRYGSNSNLTSENLPNSELHASRIVDRISDSQWTMEHLINEEPVTNASQQQPDTISSGFDPETELPSDSFSIGLDPADDDYLNVSIDTLDSSEHNLSLMQSLETDESPLVSMNRNSTLPPICLQHIKDEGNQARFNLSATENGGQDCTRQDDVRLFSAEATSSYPEHVEKIHEVNYNSGCDESSSVSTVEATFLLSHEQSLVDENDPQSKVRELLGSDKILDGSRKIDATQSIDSITEERITSLSENDEYYDLRSMDLQPSCTSDNSPYASNEISYLSLRDFSSDKNESYKNLDISNDSIDYSYQKSEADLIRIQKMRSEGIKSQDSMSFKSISDCSLDLKPKYTSSPQVCTNNDKIQGRNEHKIEQFFDKPTSILRTDTETTQSFNIKDSDCGSTHHSEIQRITTAALESNRIEVKDSSLVPKISLQSQNDENIPNRKYSLEGEKIDENEESKYVENISPSTSQLSLQSNSDISLSTATSTGSSNVDKWYSAEANPMYRQDLIALKGGNDMADNPSEETSDSDATTVSSSDKGKDRESNKVIDHTSRTSDRCFKLVRNSQPQDKSKEAQMDDLDQRTKSSNEEEPVKYYSDDLLRGKMNDKLLSCFLGRKNHSASLENSHSHGAMINDILSSEKSSPNIVVKESISTHDASGVVKQTNTRSFASDCQKIEQTIYVETVSSSDPLDRSSENETIFGKVVTCISDNILELDDTNGVPTSPSETNGLIDQKDTRSDIFEVSKTLAASTKMIFEKINVTRCTLETSLRTTKKLAEILPVATGETESDVTDNSMKMVNDFSEQVQNSSRVRPFLFTRKDAVENVHQPEQSSDLRPFGFLKQTGNDFQTLDILGTVSSCISTSGNEVSTSCNVSKIGKERGQVKYEIDVVRELENVESKPFSPGSLDTPPNSWSPEIMDSGYPNSASVHDITPEYELSSIANDRISDSDSASIEEMPVPAVYEFLEVENGDLANNNRDDEGNNVIAFEANDLDDLQPLIDVLENDMENENDIYVLQNGFPMWLLRILEMANPIDLEGMGGQQAQLYPAPLEQAGGDAANVNADNDEGFDSSSSEDDSDGEEDDEADDATTVSSDETDEHSAENVTRDWRAGGDP